MSEIEKLNVAPQSDADAIQKAIIDAIEDFGIERFAISLCEARECVTEAAHRIKDKNT